MHRTDFCKRVSNKTIIYEGIRCCLWEDIRNKSHSLNFSCLTKVFWLNLQNLPLFMTKMIFMHSLFLIPCNISRFISYLHIKSMFHTERKQTNQNLCIHQLQLEWAKLGKFLINLVTYILCVFNSFWCHAMFLNFFLVAYFGCQKISRLHKHK